MAGGEKGAKIGRMRKDLELSGVTREVPDGAGGAAPVTAPGRIAQPRPQSVWKWVGTAASIAIVVISLFVLVHTLAKVDIVDLRNAIRATSFEQIVLACFFTAISYLALTGYDAIALRHLHLKVPYRTTALGSFTSYAISFTVGFYIVTAGAVRYWIYSREGLSAGKVASLTVIAGLTFWLGISVAIAAGLVIEAGPLAEIDALPAAVNMVIGIAVLMAIVAYLVWVARGRRRARLQGFYLELPRPGLTLSQMILGVIDVCAAAAALYALLPPGHGLAFVTFAATYGFACLLAMASHAPGGIGVLEATMLKVVSVPSPALLASLLLFRAIYYLVPFVLALALLGASE
ncbi:MAG: UPF0104 family protein, partial [Methylobacteriaceae bacterium]|nr:UPF0104 family protein [Methylobacteriaceae bacterium]